MSPRRSDANQREIVAALRQAGAFVCDLHSVGRGCPDLLVGFRGTWHLIEVKTATGSLEGDQEEWHFAALPCRVFVVRSVDEALRSVEAIR